MLKKQIQAMLKGNNGDQRSLSAIFLSDTDRSMVLVVTTASRLAFVPFKDAIANRMAYLFRIPQKPKTSVSVPLELAAARRFVILDNVPGDRLARVLSPVDTPEQLDDQNVVYLNYNNRAPGRDETVGSGCHRDLPPGLSISHTIANANGVGSTHTILGRDGDGRLGLGGNDNWNAKGFAFNDSPLFGLSPDDYIDNARAMQSWLMFSKNIGVLPGTAIMVVVVAGLTISAFLKLIRTRLCPFCEYT
jgi:hypothetical protein